MPCFYSLLHRPATPQIYTLSLHDALPIYFDPLDEEAVEEQADAEGKAAAHGDRERRERAAVRLRDLDNGKDEAQRAHGNRHAGPEDDQPVQRTIRPKAHWCP